MRKFYVLLFTAVIFAAIANAQSTTLINPAGDGGFENGTSFAANGWTVVNGATNQWFVGSVATASAGTNSAYVSDNASGTTHNYTLTTASTVHFYRDISFPAGQTNIVLSFKWKGQGESNYDYVTVYSMPTSVTPVFNTPAGGYQSWLNIATNYSGATVHASPNNLNLQSTYQTQTICLPASYAGTTRRLVFMWSNDGSGGVQPPASIDEISLVASAPTAPSNSATGLSLSATTSQITGSFTAAVGGADGYLVVRYPAGATPVAPTNGTTYTAGTALGTGVVAASTPLTSFTATGVTPSTNYDIYVYSYNNFSCSGGAVYKTTAPLTGTQATPACSGLSGTYSVGPTGAYTTLTAALTALSAGATSAVTFELQSTYTSGTETFPLTFPANGCINAGSPLTIRPATGATALSITSSNATATIDFNSATYVTIDGRPGGVGTTSQLTIANTATGSPSAIRFINDASNNTVTYCSVQGSATTSLGVISFSTGIVTGNDNNTISNNNISAAGANLPLNGIYSLGTSAVVDNSGNTVTGNNIFDYFNASSATSGINVNSFNSGWTITNNRLYQTATRTYTTGTTHNGINISSGSGYTINNNVIGYANAAGTGTTNLVGNSVALAGFPGSYVTSGTANATRYIAINAAFTAGGAVSNIQGNTVAGFALFTSSGATTTNGILCGIAVTSGNVNIGTTTGNTIGATTGTGSIYTCNTTSGGAIVGIYVSSADAINIRNNTIGALDAMGSTTSLSGSITGINIAGASSSYDVSGNTIGNSTNPNLRMGNLTTGSNLSNVGTTFGPASGLGLFQGILSGIATVTATGTIGTAALPNIIRNATVNSTSTSTAGGFRGIMATGSPVISSNTITNLSSASTNAGVSSTLLAGMGIFLNSISVNGAVVTKNTISNLSLTNTTTSGTNLTGIALYCGTTEVSGNKIFGLSNASTSTTAATPGTASGIFLRQPAGVQTIINNMISLGSGQTTNTSFNGIWMQNSVVAYTLNAYFNSIHIEGTAASGAQPSFAFNRGSYSTTTVTITVDLRNNIFSNVRSGGTGKHYAIANCYLATATNTGWGAGASNYNILNGTAANIGYWTSDQTFAAWQTSSSCDANSLTAASIGFTNTATGDLHITSFPTAVEGAGISIAAVTTDYDGDIRANFSPTDIGADAGNFFSYPVISYTALGNACAPGARTLTATITDVDGVPTTGSGLPVLYWKVNSGTYTAVTGVSLGSNQYQFTFGGSAVNGDIVSYYVAAQDNLNNVGCFPSFGAGGFTANPPAAATPPTSPSSYNVLTLSGTYTVGVGGNYPTLTAAVNAYNNACLGGPVVFSLTDATYPSETYPIQVNANAQASAVNTLTIRPATGVTPVISGSSTGAMIKLNGADYVTIDGSNNGTTTRDLTITNTSTGTSSSIIWLASTTTPDGATNNTIKNCNIVGNASTTTFGGIFSSGSALGGVAEIANVNNSYINNAVNTSVYGIAVVGPTGNETGTVISGNTVGTANAANKIGLRGIAIFQQAGASVTGNTVLGISSANASSTSPSCGIYVAGTISNGVIESNKISDIKNTNTGGWASEGIALNSSSAACNLTISNNMIWDVAGYGYASNNTDNGHGISIIGTGGGYNIYYNTINMATDQTVAGNACALFVNTGTGHNIRNNILLNNQTSASSTRYVIISTVANTAYTDINYNDYYSAGSTIGYLGTAQNTLAAWQAATGKDANSLNLAPVLVSSTNLHLSNAAGANWCLNGKGTTIAGITSDIDGDLRGTPPDIGADEFVATSDDVATPLSQSVCSGTPITTIGITGSAGTYTWTRDNTGSVTGIAASGTGNISGTLVNTTNAPVTVTFTIVPTIGTCTFTPIVATVTVNPIPNAVATPASQTICSNGSITTIALTGNVSGTTYNWTRDNTASVSGIAASGSGDISGSLVNNTNDPITVTFTITPVFGTCSGTAVTATVTVNPTVTRSGGPGSQSICSGDAIAPISFTSPVTGASFTWTRNNTGTVTGIAASGTGMPITGSLTNTTAADITVSFTISVSANGCPGPDATVFVTVKAKPVTSAILTQPTTCVSADGAINLTVTGAPGPYTYSWSTAGGSGLVAGQEDQSGLTVGQYTVVVTAANGCTTSAVYDITGPGGCAVCPIIGSFTSTPAGPVCAGTNLTLNASGLTFMGVTYGITFKYSNAPLADPYTGGTVIATIPNGSLGGGGTTATTSTSFATAGTYYIYSIISPNPIDPSCRPVSLVTMVVNPIPTVDPVANQVVCNNGSTTPVSFSGTVVGTSFNWTNNNTSIGLAASGTGNIASFTATNTGTTPVTATVTVTPSVTTMAPASQTFNFTGAVQQWTVPAGVTSINIDAYGAEGGTGAAGGGAGNLGGAGGKGTKASGTLAVTPGQVLNIYVGGAGGQATGGYNGGGTGGNALSGGGGGASDVRFPGTSPSDRLIVAAGGGGGGRGGCETNTSINGGPGGNGDADGVNGSNSPDGGGGFGGTLSSGGAAGIGCTYALGLPGVAGTAAGVGGDGGAGQSCCCFSNPSLPGGGGGGGGYVGGGSGGGGSAGTTGCSFNNKGGGGGGAGGTSYTGGVTSGTLSFGTQSGNGMVVITYTAPTTTCTGTPRTFTYTVNPTPTVNAVSNQVVCNGATTAAVTFGGAVTGTVYNWTNNNTSIGLGASGTGNIGSFTAINTGIAPVVATITVTPSYTNAGTTCTGTPVTFTITVNPTPTAVATPSAQTICTNTAITPIVLSGTIGGTTYNWTRNNTVNVTGIAASGSGNISGTLVNTTTAQQVVTFTITPTVNGCPGTPVTATVTVNAPPVITCPANVTVNNTAGQCGANVTYPPAVATGSPAPVITYSQASGSFFPVGTTIVTATATNACGSSTCTFTVTVVDAQAPTILCPANISVSSAAGICGANVTYPFPSVSDNCALPGGTPVGLSQTTNNTTITPIQIGCQYAGGVTAANSWWRAYNLAPLNLPAGLTIKNVRFGIEKITGTTVPITARIYTSAGAFPGAARTLVATQTANFAPQTGTFGVITFSTPAVVASNAIVVVELFCPDQQATGAGFYIGSNALGESAPSYLSAVACGIANPTEIATLVPNPLDHIILNINAEYYTSAPTLVQIAGLPSGGLFPVGTTTNTFRATDAAGNTSTCSFTVTVNDVQAPVVSCPANIVRNTDAGVCTASVAVPNPTFSDNCAVTQLTWTMTGATTASSPATGINFVGTRTFNLNGTTGSGVTTVTYTARDAAGNTTSCSFTVTVNDAVRPIISGQPATRFTCAGSNAVFTVGAGSNGGPLAYQWQEWNGSAWVNIAGATSSTVTINNVSFTDNTRPFRVILTGLCTIVTSDAAILYVNPLPTVSLTTSIPPILSPAQSMNINAVANPAGGTYVWSFNGTVVPGRTGSSWNGVTVDGIGTYRVTYTDPNGCTSASADLVVSGQQSDGLYVYPNPNNGQFIVRYYNQLNENITVNVYDAKGSRVFQKLALGGTAYTAVEVSLGNQFAAGVYVVQVVNGSGKIVGSRQVIVRHR